MGVLGFFLMIWVIIFLSIIGGINYGISISAGPEGAYGACHKLAYPLIQCESLVK